MSQIACAGVVVTDSLGTPQCQDTGGAPLAWTTTPAFSISALDPVMASGAFAAGFFIMAMGWAISRGLRVLLDMFK
ncbi:MAG: hypothetical protein SXG53_22855 [Pseudomonadota bacterium]|nr:hypothetical protein [Pseudomonadota bacterium]